jgi:uncharacterized UBP type Zn finger protein
LPPTRWMCISCSRCECARFDLGGDGQTIWGQWQREAAPGAAVEDTGGSASNREPNIHGPAHDTCEING